MSGSFREDDRRMKILITGATGFIGRHLTLKLKLLGHELITISRRPVMRNKKDVKLSTHYALDLGEVDRSKDSYYMFENICRQHSPDLIFHLASNAVVKPDDDNPHGIILDNTISTQKVAHYAPEGCKVVLASSVIVYGDWMFQQESPRPYTEEDRTEPTSIYGITKQASEGSIRYHSSTGQINGVSARMCATVGRGLTHGVVYDFIRKILNNPTLEALGSKPGSTKPYCYIEDLKSALILLAMKDSAEGAYNIVPDDAINIEQVAKAVMSGLEVYKNIEWLGDGANWKGDNKLISVSNDKLKSIGWTPKYSSKEAIFEAVRSMS